MSEEYTNNYRQLTNKNKNEKAMKKIKKIQESWNKRNENKLIITQEPTTNNTTNYQNEKQRKTHHTQKMQKSKASTKQGISSKVDVEIQKKFKDLAEFIEKTIK